MLARMRSLLFGHDRRKAPPESEKTNKLQDDPLLRRIELARRNAEIGQKEVERATQEERAPAEQVLDITGIGNRYIDLRKIYEGIVGIWNKPLNPFSYIVNPLFRLYSRWCQRIFRRYAYDKQGTYIKNGTLKAVMMIAVITAAVVYITPSLIKLVYDGIIIDTFSYEGTRYFRAPIQISEDDNIWSVSSCSKLPCRAQIDSIEFRMRDSAYLDLKRMLVVGEVHDPGELAGGFPSEQNACNFKAAGRRIKIPFAPISWGFYANIHDAFCDSVIDENRHTVLEELEAMRLAGKGFPSIVERETR